MCQIFEHMFATFDKYVLRWRINLEYIFKKVYNNVWKIHIGHMFDSISIFLRQFRKNLTLRIHTMVISLTSCIRSTIMSNEENYALPLNKTFYVLLQIVRVTLHPVIHESNFFASYITPS